MTPHNNNKICRSQRWRRSTARTRARARTRTRRAPPPGGRWTRAPRTCSARSPPRRASSSTCCPRSATPTARCASTRVRMHAAQYCTAPHRLQRALSAETYKVYEAKSPKLRLRSSFASLARSDGPPKIFHIPKI